MQSRLTACLRPVLLLALIGSAALLLAACGGDDGPDTGDLGPDPATLAPASALVYGDLVVQPEGEQRDAINESIGGLIGEEDPVGLLESELGAVLSDAADGGLSFEEDIQPWLAGRAGFFLTEISASDALGAAVIATDDTDAARSAIDKLAEQAGEEVADAEYEGTSYKVDEEGALAIGVVDEFVVGGPEPAFQAAVDAASGDALADSGDAADALGDAPDGSLFRVYADTQAVLDAAIASGGIGEEDIAPFEEQLAGLGDAPIVLSGLITGDEISLEVQGPGDESAGEDGESVAELPGDAWLALAAPAAGEQIGTVFEQVLGGFEEGLEELGPIPGAELPDVRGDVEAATGLDLATDLDWAGDLGLFLEGSSVLGVGGGARIETEDEQAARDAIGRLGRALSREPSVQVSQTDSGLQIQASGAPIGAEIVVQEGRVVLAGGAANVDDVVDPAETLAESDRFTPAAEALGEDLEPGLFIDIETIVALIESTGQVGDDPGYQAAKRILDQLDYVIAGGSADGDGSTGRIVLGLTEPSDSSGESAALTP